jgi:hypothetical protein
MLELIEQLEDQVNIFAFGLLASAFTIVLLLINHLKTELNKSSSYTT